jgi:hypothetical protein
MSETQFLTKTGRASKRGPAPMTSLMLSNEQADALVGLFGRLHPDDLQGHETAMIERVRGQVEKQRTKQRDRAAFLAAETKRQR